MKVRVLPRDEIYLGLAVSGTGLLIEISLFALLLDRLAVTSPPHKRRITGSCKQNVAGDLERFAVPGHQGTAQNYRG